jgi:hypothetical protein
MKLIMITALREYGDTAAGLLKQAGITVFSMTDTIGSKNGSDQNLMDSWFGLGDAKFDSVFLFSFTEEGKAKTAMALIRDYNGKNPGDFPIQGFLLPVEEGI